MELEKEIVTAGFKDEYHKGVVNIIFTYSWITTQLKKRVEKNHITLQQYNILRILRGQYPQPATVNLLKERMLDKMSDASRIVERLVQKGLVARCTNQTDRRAVDISISEKGLNLLEKLDPEMGGDLLLSRLTEQEVNSLNVLLDKLRG
ncbi:MarR family transcriptional regulator [Pedobacter sp. HMF7647]|uniref:MarR family transcriptional regulator n=1 Tax=Hufsiella arboris TaxID=2695275 RepID=A0A7K1YD45_9SPHI|nr:MarR family transcriptional regulator [Hufsiella arboris]MXV52503.1 MarR family transcriptional regulator [Hufsiella arboris]